MSSSAVEVVPAEPGHIDMIADRVREADRLEIAAASGKTPREALEFSFSHSDVVFTVMFDGRAAAMFGVGYINILAGIAAPWLIGTDDVEKHYRTFLRGSRPWRDWLASRYPVMINIVDERNIVSRRWLAWMGFTFLDPVPVGKDRLPFLPFELRTPCAI